MDWDGTSERRHDPLTEEQLALISTWTTHATKKSLRHYTRNAIIGFLILLASNLYVWIDSNNDSSKQREAIVESGKVVSVAGCNRDFNTITALRGVLTNARSFQDAALKRGDITQAQYGRAQVYYDEQLKALKLPDCRDAEAILTSEKGEVPPAPKPLYPTPTK